MTVLFRCRVENPLLAEANAVTKSLGTSTAELFRIFVTEIARTSRVPVDL
jgi:antitoxin component of RelBE/YafQ-DinJ toxin-antitoxin module